MFVVLVAIASVEARCFKGSLKHGPTKLPLSILGLSWFVHEAPGMPWTCFVHLINCSHATKDAPRSHSHRRLFVLFLTGSGRSGSCFQATPGPHPPHGICIRSVAGQGSAHRAGACGTPEQEPQRSRRESLWESIRMARFPRHPEPMAALADPSSGPSNHIHPHHARAARQRSPVWGRLPSKLKLHSMV